MHQVERHVTEDREVVGAIVPAAADLIFVHHHVKHPVQPVLHPPMRANDLAKAFGRQRSTQQKIGGLGCRFRRLAGGRPADANDAAKRG